MDPIANLPEALQAAAATRIGMAALAAAALGLLAWMLPFKAAAWRVLGSLLLVAGAAGLGWEVMQFSARTSARLVQVQQGLERWVDEAEALLQRPVPGRAGALPGSVIEARDAFEALWKDAALHERLALPVDKVATGLSALVQLYRQGEPDRPLQSPAAAWADEAVEHFDARKDPRRLTDALLDKAALFVETAQRDQADPQQFDAVVRGGEALMARADRSAAEDQRPVLLRQASRFYDHLARPKSFRPQAGWDNQYLLLAYEKARAAHDLQPGELGAAHQLARTVVQAGRHPPQDTDKAWAERLRDAQDGMSAAWAANQHKLAGGQERLATLHILGTVTAEGIAREWAAAGAAERRTAAGRYLIEIDRDVLAPLREASALLQDPAARQAHGVDIHQDLARAHALKAAILRVHAPQRTRAEVQEARRHLAVARDHARGSAREVPGRDLARAAPFALLTPAERATLGPLLDPG